MNLIRTGPRGRPPVVLLHSAGLDLTWWENQIDALRATDDVAALDLPGHGRSPGTAADVAIEVMAREVTRFVARLRSGPLALLDTAARFPAAGHDAMRSRAERCRAGGTARPD